MKPSPPDHRSFISLVVPPSIETSLPPKRFLAPLPSAFSSLSFTLTISAALYHTLHESSRLCGKKHIPPTFHVSHPPSSSSSKALFFLVLFAMAAILRSLFGNSQSTTPAHGKAKTRSRTESTPAPYYVYTPSPRSTPSTSTSSSGTSLSKDQRSNSYNTPGISSSPLRYPTHDSRHSHEHSRPLYRASSHKPHPDMHGP
jgi:hypothetical protein